MIYFIVNNNFHYLRADLLRDEIVTVEPQVDTALIRIFSPALNRFDRDEDYEKVYSKHGLFGSFSQLLNLPGQWRIKQSLKRIPFRPGDGLFLFTEYELANHYLGQYAKSRGARVYLVDEGIGTYIINNYSRLTAGRSLKQRLITWVIRYLNGFYATSRLTGDETLYCPRLADRYYDGWVLFYNFSLKRDMRQIHVRLPGLKKNVPHLDPDAVLILGGYNGFYFTLPEYINLMMSALRAAIKSFKRIYFKFHQAELKFLEHKEYRDFISLAREAGVELLALDRPEPVERWFEGQTHPPRFVVGNITTALLTLFALGCEPIFFCHLIQDRYVDFKILTGFLKSVGYRFISNWEDIRPSYRSNLTLGKIYSQDISFGDFYKNIASGF